MIDDMTFIFNKRGYGKENWELQKRIDKAIEYIESNCNEFYVNEPHYRGYQIINIEPLLDILKGSNEDEKD